MAMLKFVKGTTEGATVELAGERIVMGRNVDCGVVLNVPAVSREHAVIRKIQGKFYIEDLKSRNGTFLNNKEVTTRTQLKDNDRIKICDNVLSYHETAPKPELPDAMRKGTLEEADDDGSTVEATIDKTARQVLEAAPSEKLSLLLEIASDLHQTLNIELLLPKIIDSMFKVFRQADRGFMIFAEDGKLIPRVIRTRRENEDTTARFSKRIVNRCIETGESILSGDASFDKRFDLSQSIADAKIRSVMCAPLRPPGAGKAFGVIQLDSQDNFKKFTEDDLKLLIAVAGQAAASIENARMHESLVERAGLERDLKIAKDVQKSFLPKRMPTMAGYEFSAYYESAQEIGGDYYDFIPLPNNRFGVMIGDVAGKGVPAALLMAKVSADSRFSILTEPTLAHAIDKLNELMQEAGQLDRFVTLGAGLLDPLTHQATFVNAGHIPPIIYRKASHLFEQGLTLDQSGFPLGIVEGIPYESNTVSLDPGDCVVLFTDGVSESRSKDEKEFGMPRALDVLKNGPMTPQAMLDRLVAAVKKHAIGRKPHDDLTVVAFGRVE